MEFYDDPAAADTARYKSFQFPTGWNSTLKSARIQVIATYSFNSQRDGILRTSGAEADPQLFVSIPNGMEFYFKEMKRAPKRNCFNSQRDGILHKKLARNLKNRKFQFPTGWNSTKTVSLKRNLKYCFNSQRDGILQTFKKLSEKGLIRFQFPTGWNSTLY